MNSNSKGCILPLLHESKNGKATFNLWILKKYEICLRKSNAILSIVSNLERKLERHRKVFNYLR